MRVKKPDNRMCCSNCGGQFPLDAQACTECQCPHTCLGWGEDVFCAAEHLWPSLVAVVADSLKETVPPLTLNDLAAASPNLKRVFENVGEKYKEVVLQE